MEAVRAELIVPRKRKPRMRVDKSAALLSLISRVLKHRYTPAKLDELIDQLTPRDQAMFICHYIKPVQPKDELESLDDHSLQRLADLLRNESKQAI
jgi:hypothetical protein